MLCRCIRFMMLYCRLKVICHAKPQWAILNCQTVGGLIISELCEIVRKVSGSSDTVDMTSLKSH